MRPWVPRPRRANKTKHAAGSNRIGMCHRRLVSAANGSKFDRVRASTTYD